MKQLHQPDLYCWSHFDETRNLDFHGYLWVRPQGNVMFDPLPLSPHDKEHLRQLGGVSLILLTNSDHARGAQALARETGARLVGPAGEKDAFPFPCDLWIGDGDEPVPGLRTFALEGSKTPGELAFLLEETTLITGDLIRGQQGGRLNLLPPAKLKDPARALASAARFLDFPRVEAVLVGDGWPVFRQGHLHLRECVEGARGR